MINRFRMPLAKRCLIFALFFATCLAPLALWASPEKMSEAEAALGALAEEYWTKRLIEKDYKFSYDKELEKGTLSFSDYVSKAKAAEKFKYLSVKTRIVNIDGDRGAVYLDMECVTPFLPKGHKQMLQDLWLYRSGQWRHKFSDK